MNQIERRGEGILKALKGEAPVRRLVSVCGWCPDRDDQAAVARARGFDVTHGLCPACAKQLHDQIDAAEAACLR